MYCCSSTHRPGSERPGCRCYLIQLVKAFFVGFEVEPQLEPGGVSEGYPSAALILRPVMELQRWVGLRIYRNPRAVGSAKRAIALQFLASKL